MIVYYTIELEDDVSHLLQEDGSKIRTGEYTEDAGSDSSGYGIEMGMTLT